MSKMVVRGLKVDRAMVETGSRTESKKANPSRGGDAKPEVSLRRDGSAADSDIP
jgi:hypothetical protein